MDTILTFNGLNIYDEAIKSYIQQNSGSQTSSKDDDTTNHTITWNENETVYTQSWTSNGKVYKKVFTEVSATVFTTQLFIDGKKSGLWTTTINEANRTVSTVYTEQ